MTDYNSLGPEDNLDISQILGLDREHELRFGQKPKTFFLYSSEELNALGVPGYDRDRDEADAWNAMQLAKIAIQTETIVTHVEE